MWWRQRGFFSLSFLALPPWILAAEPFDWAMRRRGHQADYSARSSERQMEQIHNWCRFWGVCRDERAWSQRVLNIWSRTWCYCGADKQARWPRKVWQMGNTCSTVTVESLNVIIPKTGGKRGFSSLLHVLLPSQSTVVQNLFGESNGLYDINYKKPWHFLGTAF